MKKLMSLLLSSVLCLSLAMPTVAFGADTIDDIDTEIEQEYNIIDDVDVDTIEDEQKDIDDIPTVSITMNEKGEIQDINSDEGIMIEPSTENNEADDEVINDETTEDKTDDEVVNDETTEDKTDDEVVNDETTEDKAGDEVVNDETTEDNADNEVVNDETTEDKADDEVVNDETTENKADDEVVNDETKQDITDKLETENTENIETEDTQEKAAPIQGVLTDYYGTLILSEDENHNIITENIDGKGSNMQKYTYYSQKTHYNNKVSIIIRVEGLGLNERLSTSAGKIDYSDTKEPIDVIIDPTNNAMLAWSTKYNIVNLDPEEKQVRFECSVEPAQDQMKRVTRVFIIKLKGSEESGDSAAAPTSPEFIVDNNKTGLLLTGADSRMEYRKEETDTWIDCTDSDIAFAAPEANTNYYIRYKAQGDAPASQTKKITAYARPTASIIRIDAATERLVQAVGYTFDKTYEMKVDNGEYFDVTDEILETGAAPFLDKVPTGTQQTLYIRKKATDTIPAGFERQIVLLPRAATPTGLKYDKVTFQLTGVTSGMEYLNPTKSSWTSISKDINLSSLATTENAVEIKVRVKQTTTNSASRPYVFTIPKLSPAPTWKIDYKNELLTGFTANQSYEWRKSGTTTWKTFNGPSVPLSELGYTNIGFNIYVRRQQTTTEPCSAATYVNIPSRPNGPTISFVCNDTRYKDDVVLKGIDNSMQYSLDLGKTWKNVTSTEMVTDFRSTSYKIYFRYKATDNAFLSKNAIFTIGTRAKAPTVSINKTTEILNTTSVMEYSYNNVNFTHCSGNMDMKAVIDAIPTGGSKSIYIRKFATETSPYSLTKEIKIYARSNAPTTPKYDSATQKINGMTTAMMYKSNTETTWHTLSKGTSISVAGYIKNNSNVTIEIRYKATTTTSASKPLFIKL